MQGRAHAARVAGNSVSHDLDGAPIIARAERLLPPAVPHADALDTGVALDEGEQLRPAGRPAYLHRCVACEIPCAEVAPPQQSYLAVLF